VNENHESVSNGSRVPPESLIALGVFRNQECSETNSPVDEFTIETSPVVASVGVSPEWECSRMNSRDEFTIEASPVVASIMIDELSGEAIITQSQASPERLAITYAPTMQCPTNQLPINSY
jgi:hypothetical protein